jgi:FkbM family methyltransferase
METIPEKLELQQALQATVNKPAWGFRNTVKAEVRTFWGDYMNVTIPELVSLDIAFKQYYDKDLSYLLTECLDRDMVFFDVGAHYGYFTLLGAHIVGPGGQVHSFEPSKETFELLAENTRGRQNIMLNNRAVYSTTTELSFRNFGALRSAFNSLYSPRIEDQEEAKTFEVNIQTIPAISIDDYVEATGVIPDFVKVDAESAEFYIVEGMRKTLAKHRPTFTLEVGDLPIEGVRPSRELVKFALGFGYRVFASRMGALVPHSVQASYGLDNLLFVPAKM